VPLHVSLLADGSLAHSLAARDQVDEHADERDEEEDEDPPRLAQSRHLVVAEEIADDRDQDPEIDDEEENLDDRKECVTEGEVAEQHRVKASCLRSISIEL